DVDPIEFRPQDTVPSCFAEFAFDFELRSSRKTPKDAKRPSELSDLGGELNRVVVAGQSLSEGGGIAAVSLVPFAASIDRSKQSPGHVANPEASQSCH